MTNLVAFSCSCVNLIFYLWAQDIISTEQIQMLISFFQVAFPEQPEDEKNGNSLLNGECTAEDLGFERDLGMGEGELDDEEGTTKAEIHARFVMRH